MQKCFRQSLTFATLLPTAKPNGTALGVRSLVTLADDLRPVYSRQEQFRMCLGPRLLSNYPRSTPPSRSYAAPVRVPAKIEKRIADIPISRFRNFCIVAHVDHGKSTLSDRLLELTGTIEPGGKSQVMDRLDVERERGITVKAQTCSMIYTHRGEDYLLHLVDTPGHVDFRAEVSRSYASCGGAILLVDASQGVQAQTVANFYLAFAQGLQLVPVLNKVDLPSSDIPRALEQMKSSFELDTEGTVAVSAKTGLNIDQILPIVVDKVPAPVGDSQAPLQILLVDSWYDNYKGVILLVRVFQGSIRANDSITSFATGNKYYVGEVGIMYPDAKPQSILRAGQVGYCHFNPGMKQSSEAKVGDTYTHTSSLTEVKPLPGFEEPKAMVFVSAYPVEPADFSHLEDSIRQLTLNDRSVTVSKESSGALGAGFRLGFLGTLHCSVFEDRLRSEYSASIIITPPSVPYRVHWKPQPDAAKSIADESVDDFTTYSSPNEYPEAQNTIQSISHLSEPFVSATITLPEEYLGTVIELCEGSRGIQESLTFFTVTQVILRYALPLASLVDDFFGKLKGATRGYASLDYEDAGFRPAKLEKLQLLVNKQPRRCRLACPAYFSSASNGKKVGADFKEHVDRQLFEVVIQAAVTGPGVGKGKVLAREIVSPYRKDVLSKLHAADKGRKQKLLDKQKEGRKRLRTFGSVNVDTKAFQAFLSK